MLLACFDVTSNQLSSSSLVVCLVCVCMCVDSSASYKYLKRATCVTTKLKSSGETARQARQAREKELVSKLCRRKLLLAVT